MRGENIVIAVLLLILSPIIIVFSMGAIGSVMGGESQEMNILVAGIAILCDVIIGCTLIVIGVVSRLIRIVEGQKTQTASENANVH